MVETAIAWADLDLLVKGKEIECERLLWEINSKLEQLPINEKKVLELYYIKGYNIDRICCILSYCKRQVIYIKESGLKNFKDCT